jgi:hypothetical protein
MCLSKVFEGLYKYKKGCITYNLSIPGKVYTGYKICKQEGKAKHIVTPITSTIIRTGIWIKNWYRITVTAGLGGDYESGFHIYLLKKDALSKLKSHYNYFPHCVKKVKFRNVMAFGKEADKFVVVSDEIYIEE